MADLGFRTKAGDRVHIAALARELGVSQIPVREGVRRLEAEGLLYHLDTVESTT